MDFYLKCFIDHPAVADLSKSQPAWPDPKRGRGEHLPGRISQPKSLSEPLWVPPSACGERGTGAVTRIRRERLPPSTRPTLVPPTEQKRPLQGLASGETG